MAAENPQGPNRQTAATTTQEGEEQGGQQRAASSSGGGQALDTRTSVQKKEKYRFASNIPSDKTVPEQEYADYVLEYDQDDAKVPDVLLDVPVVKVDEINFELNDLRVRANLFAKVLDLVELAVGVDAYLGRVKLVVQGVEAQALLKVRLDNVAAILDRVLTTIDRNPQIVERLVEGAGSAVEDVGGGAGQAAGEVDQGAGQAAQEVGQGVGQAAQEAGQGAGQTVQEAGPSRRAGHRAGGTGRTGSGRRGGAVHRRGRAGNGRSHGSGGRAGGPRWASRPKRAGGRGPER
jgi:hypothetical protein